MSIERELFIKRQEKGILYNEIESTKDELSYLKKEFKNINNQITILEKEKNKEEEIIMN